jgi:NhaA family Na+:H+ antiporter
MTKNVPKPTKILAQAFAPVRALFVGDASAGILLILVAAAAMVAANSVLAESYHGLFHHRLTWTPIPKLDTLHLWINDGLMAVFFFVVGLEVKREWIEGQLSTAEQRRLPVMAAVAGMIVPALIYYAFVTGEGATELVRGWAIPAATDIAFAMGVLGLLGNRVPPSLRLFLLTVAIVDDIGAVLVIAFFYTANIELAWLTASAVTVGILYAMNRARVDAYWPYILLALVLWYLVLHSGVHATIAGVVAALTIPMRGKEDDTMLEHLEHGLAPWSAYLVMPVFGFANAGVALAGLGIGALLDPLPLAIAAGLFFGKQVGIFGIVFAADKLGIAARPENASWVEVWGVSILCGIGFTMSLFVSGLAFAGNDFLIEEAKIGILLGSLVSSVVGYAVLRMTSKHPA